MDIGWGIRKDASRFLAHASETPLRNEFAALRGFAMKTHAISEPTTTGPEKDQ
jgi:hypothetical protein